MRAQHSQRADRASRGKFCSKEAEPRSQSGPAEGGAFWLEAGEGSGA